ncbi:MAG: hypothetical protein JWN72_815 [Thermoleophilia bacterium]|nr:hypothetical protein [Thermoleophilia bacterium]
MNGCSCTLDEHGIPSYVGGVTNPLVSGATPQRATTTASGSTLAPRAKASNAAAGSPTRAAQTALLFQSLIQNAQLQAINAIADTSTEEEGGEEGEADIFGGTNLDGTPVEGATGGAADGVSSLGLDLSSLGVTGTDAAAISGQLQALLGTSLTGGGSTADVGSTAQVAVDAGAKANAATVASVAKQVGVDPVAAVAMMLVESGGNAHAVGDGGTSFGLFQLHEGGMLSSAGLSSTQAFDPATNARVSLTSLAHQQRIGPDRSPGEIAAASQRPADPAGYAKRVDAMMERARALLGGT